MKYIVFTPDSQGPDSAAWIGSGKRELLTYAQLMERLSAAVNQDQPIRLYIESTHD